MIAPVLLGALLGGGLWLAVTGLVPARPGLAATIAAVTATQPPPPAPALAAWLRPFASAARVLRRHGLPRAGVAQDVAICGLDPLTYLATLTAAGCGGGLTLALLATAATVASGVGWWLPLWLCAIGAAAGAAAAHLRVARRAAARRAQLRAALSVMLDIVVVALSGGAGLEQALVAATSPRLGDSWALRELRSAVVTAGRTGSPAWPHLANLGTATGVAQLVDLAAAVALTGSEGAHVRDSLAARADTLRGRQAAQLKAEARSATQRMILPLMVIGVGYLLFLVFPAIYALTHNL
jgi:tight adherence protein C